MTQIMPNIYMDERERGIIRTQFQKFPCNLIIKTLPIGDYIIAPNVVFERKRGDDFAASLCDNRLFKQFSLIKETFSKYVLILEDYEKIFSRKISKSSLYGALVYLAYKWDVSIVPTENTMETARIIWSLAKFYQKKINFIYKPPKPSSRSISEQNQLNFLQGLQLVSTKKSKYLLKKLNSPGAVISAILQTKIIKKARKNRSKIQGPIAAIKGFGPKFIELNQKVLTSEFSS